MKITMEINHETGDVWVHVKMHDYEMMFAATSPDSLVDLFGAVGESIVDYSSELLHTEDTMPEMSILVKTYKGVEDKEGKAKIRGESQEKIDTPLPDFMRNMFEGGDDATSGTD